MAEVNNKAINLEVNLGKWNFQCSVELLDGTFDDFHKLIFPLKLCTLECRYEEQVKLNSHENLSGSIHKLSSRKFWKKNDLTES